MVRLFLFLSVLNCVFSHQTSSNYFEKTSPEKIYVDLKDLVSDSDGFWFQLPASNFIFGGATLHSDRFGVYLDQNGVQWICRKCRFLNDDLNNPICQNCGHNRFND